MLKSLVNLIFPPLCCGCNNPINEVNDVLCIACRHDVPYTNHYLDPYNETVKKFAGRLELQHASALLYFHKQGMVQQLIHNLKYRKQQQAGQLMGQWYVPLLQQVPALQTVTDVVPVPLHPKRLRERGYNQVAQFGQAVASGLGVAYNDTVLLRANYAKTQTKKNRELRAGIINTAFAVNDSGNYAGRHFLLVDDVITTGATLEACGRLLLQLPQARVSIITIAYAQS